MVLPDYREVFGGLTDAVTSLFCHDSVLTPEEAREYRRHKVGPKLKRLLVVVGLLVRIFRLCIALHLLGMHAIPLGLRYFL